MVLCLKARESRSLPGLKNTAAINAGWSSLVARQAHNLKVAGSNPAPATNLYKASLVYSTNTFQESILANNKLLVQPYLSTALFKTGS